MTARHHHYLPQCYLKGFTLEQRKESKLLVIDLRRKKSFETVPRNVGGVRDFNRIEAEGVDPNILESSLSKPEAEAAAAIERLKETHAFTGRDKEAIIWLMALLAVRSPEQREHKRQFHAELAERIMDLLHDSKERWEQEMDRLKRDDPSFKLETTFEDSKRFHESKSYTIEVAREHQIRIELAQMEALVPHLMRRNWILLKADSETGPFITTDCPVRIDWRDPDSVPAFYKNSPGFGSKGTEVYFPVTQDLALVGEFGGPTNTLRANETIVAGLNAQMLYNVDNQLYAPTSTFKFLGKENVLLTGERLLETFNN